MQPGNTAPVAPAVPVWLRRAHPVDIRVAATTPTVPNGFSTTANPDALVPGRVGSWRSVPVPPAPWQRRPVAAPAAQPPVQRDYTFPAIGGGTYQPPQLPGADSMDFFRPFYRYGYPYVLGPDGRPTTDWYGNPIRAPFVIGGTGTTGPDAIAPMDIDVAFELGEELGAPMQWEGIEDPDGDGNFDYPALDKVGHPAGTSHYGPDGQVDGITLDYQLFPEERRQTAIHEAAHAIFDVMESDPQVLSILTELKPRLDEFWLLVNDGNPVDRGYGAPSLREGLAEFLRSYDANAAWMDVEYGDVVGTLMWLINTNPHIAPHVQMVMARAATITG
jgi:hypothetical protein